MPTVWIPQDQGKNFQPAEKFGSLRVALVDVRSRQDINYGLRCLSEEVFNHALPDDYIVLAGNPIYSSFLLHLFLNRYGKANVLLWDKRQLTYTMHSLQL